MGILKKQKLISRWILGIVAGIILLLFGLYPQIRLWRLQGANWHGAYAYNDLDEMAYAAYLQALIDNRPRLNDPYAGQDATKEKPQPESLFSIQFFAPYFIALPSRALGISASTALIFTSAITAFLTALALFWLIVSITDDSLFSFTAALVVLCCGVLAIGEGAFQILYGSEMGYPYFPFLRRYVPAVPFPFFFLFCYGIWQILNLKRQRFIYIGLSAICFTILVYSYFYLWTSAAVFLICLTIVLSIFRPDDWKEIFKRLLSLGALCLFSLIPYFVLLSNRTEAIDEVQLLVRTRMPDLLRPTEILSLFAITLLAFSVWRKFILSTDSKFIFTISLTLINFSVFNQQIITERSLQPIHYQVFITNYLALISISLALFVIWNNIKINASATKKLLLLLVSVSAIIWGGFECVYTVNGLDNINLARDESKLVGGKLTELGKTELFDDEGHRRITLNFNLLQGDDQPSIAPQAVLWARHSHVFNGASWQENKERLYHFFYYVGMDENELEQQLRARNSVITIALFGWGRHTKRLTSDYKPLTNSEIENEVKSFAQFRANFNLETAQRFKLSYVIFDSSFEPYFINIDRWYQRDGGEKIGKFMLYRLQIKND